MGKMGTVPHPPWVKSRWDRRSAFCGLLGWAFGPGIVVKTLPVIDQPRVDASPGVDRKGGEERGVPHPHLLSPGIRDTEKPPWNTAEAPVSRRYSGASGRRFFSERPTTEGSTRRFRPSHRMYGEPSTRTPARWSDVTCGAPITNRFWAAEPYSFRCCLNVQYFRM